MMWKLKQVSLVLFVGLSLFFPKESFGDGVTYLDQSSSSQIAAALAGKEVRNVASAYINNDNFRDIFFTFKDGTGMFFKGIFSSGNDVRFDIIAINIWETGSELNSGACGLIFADFNNDGFLDFYAPNPTGHQLFKYLPPLDPESDDFGKFEDVTFEMGLSTSTETINGAWGDYDGDSYVDLIIIMGDDDSSLTSGSSGQIIYHNEINDTSGEFKDSNIGSGIGFVGGSYVVSAHWADFDLDNDVDLLLTQGTQINGNTQRISAYYMNNGEGPQFLSYKATMTDPFEDDDSSSTQFGNDANLTTLADFDNDGFLDVLYSNKMHYGIYKYKNDGGTPIEGAFEYVWGSGRADGNFCSVWDLGAFDADLDGTMDHVTVRGATPGGGTHIPRYMVTCWEGGKPRFDVWPPNHIYSGCHNGQVFNPSQVGGLGMMAADFTGDGQTEIFFAGSGIQFAWYIYDAPTNNWVGFNLSSPNGGCNFSVLGATVILEGEDHKQAQLVDGGSGRASQSDLGLTFGLGSYSGAVDLKIVLPNKGVEGAGNIIYLSEVPTGQYWAVVVDGIENGTVYSKISYDPISITLNLDISWTTIGDTDSTLDQLTFHTDEPDAMVPSQLVHTGGHTIVDLGNGKYRHKITASGLECSTTQKFYFSLQSRQGGTIYGSSIYEKQPRYCLVVE